MSIFDKDEADFLDELLRGIENQLPNVDRSIGSQIHIHCVALRSAIWGINMRQQRLEKQIFPGTADRANLERHCSNHGVKWEPSETASQLLARLTARMRNQPSGAAKDAWKRWAKGGTYDHGTWVENCKAAWCEENQRGKGTINVPIQSDRSEDPNDHSAWETGKAYVLGDTVKDDSVDGTMRVYVARTAGTSAGTGVADDTGVSWEDAEEYASPQLASEVTDAINANRPVGIWDFQVHVVRKKTTPITLEVTGTNLVISTIISRIRSLAKGHTGGATLYRAQIESEAIVAGAENATVTSPSSDITVQWGPRDFERVWPGLITVTIV